MPMYDAYCPKCGKVTEYFATIEDRDRALTDLDECCNTALMRQIGAPGIDIQFKPGKYDVGIGAPKHYGSLAEMRRDVDNHNRKADAGQARHINLIRER